ncbi:MAG: amidohydrolase [Steroidobacteraceae bacterium]
MQKFIVALLLSACAGPVLACNQLTIFPAGRIYTMNPAHPVARVIATCGERIVALADSEADLEPWTRHLPTHVDTRLQDKILLPGLIDAHQHALLGPLLGSLPNIASFDTLQADGSPIPGVKDAAEAFERLRAFDQAMGDNAEPLLAWGWDVPVMGRHLTRSDLDAISTTRPIAVWDASEHHAYANTALIEQAGLQKLAGQAGVGVDEAGRVNGQFLGTHAGGQVLLPIVASRLGGDAIVQLAQWMVRLNHANGVTFSTEHVLGGFNLKGEAAALAAVFSSDDTPQRLMAISNAATLLQAGEPDQALQTLRDLRALETPKLFFRGVKFFTDDSFNGLTFKPGQPGYVDGHEGLWLTPPDALVSMMRPFWEAGEQLFVHSIGVEAHDATLAALRKLQDAKPRLDHRLAFEHFGLVRYDQVRAMHALGAVANVNPFYLWMRAPLYREQLGADRAERLTPLGLLVREGIPVALHSDYPIGQPRPLKMVSIAVERNTHTNHDRLAPELAVTVEQALRMVTLDAAHVLGVDASVGSLEPGKLADITILEADPFEVAPAMIGEIPIWGTVVGGRVFPLSASEQ